MARLIIVAGASGAGKSFLLEQISFLDSSIIPVTKLTTRKRRQYETKERRLHLDLDFGHSKKDIDKCEYKYQYGHSSRKNHWYGTKKADIDDILRKGQNPFLIVRDRHTIRRILRDYPEALVVYLQSGLSGKDLADKLKAQGRPDISVGRRMHQLTQDFMEYVRGLDTTPPLWHYTIVNYYEEQSLLDQMRAVLGHELPRETTFSDFVFVLMPLKKEFQAAYVAISTAGRLLNGKPLRVEKADDKRGVFKITDAILQNIRQAALIIAEVTEPNPNVYFEIGYARGIGKPVLPCARQGTVLPFDLKDDHTIFYEEPTELLEKLSNQLRSHFPLFIEKK